MDGYGRRLDQAVKVGIETAKHNRVDPRVWLTDILSRTAEHKIQRPSELWPWSETRQSRA